MPIDPRYMDEKAWYKCKICKYNVKWNMRKVHLDIVHQIKDNFAIITRYEIVSQ